jgi:hypothetical protein
MLINTLTVQSRVLLYEEMVERYSDSHPFLLVRLADIFVSLGSIPVAVDLYYKVMSVSFPNSTSHQPHQAQGILSRMGFVDKGLDAIVQKLAARVNDQVKESLAKSRQCPSFSPLQMWRVLILVICQFHTFRNGSRQRITSFPPICHNLRWGPKKSWINGRN